jgi:hypothetical protein
VFCEHPTGSVFFSPGGKERPLREIDHFPPHWRGMSEWNHTSSRTGFYDIHRDHFAFDASSRLRLHRRLRSPTFRRNVSPLSSDTFLHTNVFISFMWLSKYTAIGYLNIIDRTLFTRPRGVNDVNVGHLLTRFVCENVRSENKRGRSCQPNMYADILLLCNIYTYNFIFIDCVS